MHNHYTKEIFSKDRLTLFNYYLCSPHLFTSKLETSESINEITYNINNSIREASLTLVTFTKFIWNELFTSWDRLYFEFEFAENFNRKSFAIICKDNYKFLSKTNQATYNRLLFLLKNDTRENIYIYLINYIRTIYQKFNRYFPNIEI